MPLYALASDRRPAFTHYFAANHAGAMLAVPVPADIAGRIALQGGEAPEDLHVTLFYFGDAVDVAAKGRDAIIYTTLGVAAACRSFDVALEGTQVFEENEERPLVACVKSPGLVQFRAELARAFDEADIDYSQDYEYLPHVTLKYLNQEPAPSVEVREAFTVNAIEAYFGEERYRLLCLYQRYHFARKPAGQRQRIGAGSYEGMANRQQRALVRAYDAWAAKVKKELARAAEAGADEARLTALLQARLPDLEEALSKVTEQGVQRGANVGAGKRVDRPVVQRIIEDEKAANRELVKGALIPNIEARLLPVLAAGAALTSVQIQQALNGSRVLPAQYAGGSWVAIFKVQQGLGKEREKERAAEGLTVEPVRWVLDPSAEHCTASTGYAGAYYGCPDLAKEYSGGWNTLPTVPAGQVTCRGNCVLEGTIVDALDIEAIYRLPYAGPVLELITKSGLHLTVTPNHPVLTRHGWVKAHFLNKGEDIVGGSRSKTISQTVNGNNNDVPTRIEKVFDAFLMTDAANRFRHSFIPMSHDFHGDGRFVNGNVDIIRADRQLLNELNPFDFEHPRQFEFGGGSLRQSGLTPQSAGMQILRRPLPPPDSIMSRFADSLPFFRRSSFHSSEHGIASPAWFNSMLQKLVPETTATDTCNQRELLFTLAREITLDKIDNVRHYNYIGHVYDLQSFGSLYSANGVLVHNCRCHLEVLRNGEWRRGIYDD